MKIEHLAYTAHQHPLKYKQCNIYCFLFFFGSAHSPSIYGNCFACAFLPSPNIRRIPSLCLPAFILYTVLEKLAKRTLIFILSHYSCFASLRFFFIVCVDNILDCLIFIPVVQQWNNTKIKTHNRFELPCFPLLFVSLSFVCSPVLSILTHTYPFSHILLLGHIRPRSLSIFFSALRINDTKRKRYYVVDIFGKIQFRLFWFEPLGIYLRFLFYSWTLGVSVMCICLGRERVFVSRLKNYSSIHRNSNQFGHGEKERERESPIHDTAINTHSYRIGNLIGNWSDLMRRFMIRCIKIMGIILWYHYQIAASRSLYFLMRWGG